MVGSVEPVMLWAVFTTLCSVFRSDRGTDRTQAKAFSVLQISIRGRQPPLVVAWKSQHPNISRCVTSTTIRKKHHLISSVPVLSYGSVIKKIP